MFGYGNGTGTGWQNHWLALALTVGVIGMLIIFGLSVALIAGLYRLFRDRGYTADV